MASLQWMADGIENAERCGGVTLDKARKLGFVSGTRVQVRGPVQAAGIPFDPEPEPDPEPYEDSGEGVR